MSPIEQQRQEQIQALSVEEVAVNLARLKFIACVVRNETIASHDDGQAAYELAKPAELDSRRYKKYWTNPADRQEAFDILSIYQLRHGAQLHEINQAVQSGDAFSSNIEPLPAGSSQYSVQEKAQLIRQKAFLTGLGRAGLVERDDAGRLTIPVATEAALRYSVGTFRDDFIGSLLPYWRDIDSKTEEYQSNVRLRSINMPMPQGRQHPMTIYRAAPDLAKDYDLRSNKRIEATTPATIWWEELTRDLEKIGRAAVDQPELEANN